MRKLFYLLFISVALLSCNSAHVKTTQSNLDQILAKFHDASSAKVMIAAHRAENDKYPENTIAAIDYSAETGVDVVELDVRTTKDGKIVLFHDGSSLERMVGKEGTIRDYTYDELLKFNLKKKKSDDPAEYKIPLALEAFKHAHGKLMVDIDIKDVSIKQLVDIVHAAKLEKQALFFDSDFAVLDSVLLLDSTLMVMPRARSLEDVKKIIARYHPPIIHIDPSFYTDEVVKTIKDAGARIWINALGKADIQAKIGLVDSAYTPLIEKGANVLQTDLPLIMNDFLVEKNLR